VIRLIGAILIIAGTTAWGVSGAMALRSRCADISSVRRALGAMEREICDRLAPMPDIAERLSKDADMPARAFFENVRSRMDELGSVEFSAIWRHALADTPQLNLTGEELDVLGALSLVLGRYDTQEQRREIRYAASRFEEFSRRAELSRDRNGRVRAFLGVAAGVFAVLILI
jgi:stage III sporulation protein AB